MPRGGSDFLKNRKKIQEMQMLALLLVAPAVAASDNWIARTGTGKYEDGTDREYWFSNKNGGKRVEQAIRIAQPPLLGTFIV